MVKKSTEVEVKRKRVRGGKGGGGREAGTEEDG